jgi:hypothetical protein
MDSLIGNSGCCVIALLNWPNVSGPASCRSSMQLICAPMRSEAAGMYELPGYVLPGGYIITGADLVQIVLAECFGPVREAAGSRP